MEGSDGGGSGGGGGGGLTFGGAAWNVCRSGVDRLTSLWCWH